MSLSKIVCRLSTLRKSSLWTFVDDHYGAAVFSHLSSSSAQIVLLSTLLRIFTFSFYTHNVCTDYLRQKNTFGHWTPLHYPASGHFIHESNVAIGDSLEHRGEQIINNPRRRKKHRGKCAGIRNRLRERAHILHLPSILLANIQSLENKMDDLRARISFQWDIRDCNIRCLTETWLTPSVPDTAVTQSDNFSVLRMDRTAEAGKTKGGGVCFMINKKWCDPRSISILSFSCSPHLEHLSIICRPFYLPREFSSIVITTVYIPPQADTSLAWAKLHVCSADILTNTLTLPLSSRGTLTKPASDRSCRTFINMYPVQLEDRIHWIIATLSLRMPTKPAHYRLLANRTMPPFSSHRNINKGSLMNRRWRGKWRAGPPTLKLCYRRLLMTLTGTCYGWVHLTSASSRM